MRRINSILILTSLLVLLISNYASANDSAIMAFPTHLTIQLGQTGKSTIQWRAEGISTAEVRVSTDGQSETVFAQGEAGAQEAPWILANHIYEFNLYTGPGNSLLLDKVTVIGMEQDDTFDSYAPLRERKSGLIINKNTLIPISQWATNPADASRADVAWGNPNEWPVADYEEWEVKLNCGMNKDFVWVNAFREFEGIRHVLRTTKALLINKKGEVFDISDGGQCGTEGKPYALYQIDNDPYVMKVWGDILDQMGEVGRRFYWEHLITPYQAVENDCWQTDNKSFRIAIRQDEAWWDSDQGWGIGTGDFDPQTNEPDGTGVFYGRYQTIARGAGYGWTHENWDPEEEIELCLQHGWSW